MNLPGSRAVILDTSHSQFARLSPVPLDAVSLEDSFWAPRRRLNREVTLTSQHRLLEETGRIDNFRRAAGKVGGPFRGYYYNDSDVYKWLEAASWTLAGEEDPELAGMVERVIDEIAAAQQPDGYLNTYFTFELAVERWKNLRDKHELYCAGHLIQAAIAHRRSTGSERLFEVARCLADHIGEVFCPGKRPGTPGHPEIEMALVELSRETGEADYLELAQWFLDNRGKGLIGGREYHIDHQPFRRLERLAGHAVRALYLCAGAADLYAETGETELRGALERLWEHLVERQTYVTGGVGARHGGEAFGEDYELPNDRAYAETCAAIASWMWNWRMLQIDGDARYADGMELALYNSLLAGISLSGRDYFYVNPLADPYGRHRRQPWYDCACCPTNIVRPLAALPGCLYSTSAGPAEAAGLAGIWIHHYAQSRAEIPLPDGRRVGIRQRTEYPWEGEIHFEIESQGEFSLYLRIPGWCETASLDLNGGTLEERLQPGVYAHIHRLWQVGDSLDLHLPMPVQRITSQPYVLENTGRVALKRGPLVYCLESADHPEVDLRDIRLPEGEPLAAEFRPDLLGGVTVLRFQGEVIPTALAWQNQLYRPVNSAPPYSTARSTSFTSIPYYAWNNRDPGPMQVWLRYEG